MGRPPAYRRRARPLHLDADRRSAHAPRRRGRLRGLPQLPGAARFALSLSQHRPRPGADPHARVLQHPQAAAGAGAAADRLAVGGGRRHRVRGVAPRRGVDAGGARASRGDAAGRAPSDLPSVDPGRDRARARPLSPGAPLRAVGGDARAAQEPADAAARVRPPAGTHRHRQRRPGSGDHRRSRLARSPPARRARAPAAERPRPRHRLRPRGRSGGAVRRRRGAGLSVALRGVRAARAGGDGLRHAGGRVGHLGAARGQRRRGDAGSVRRRSGAGRQHRRAGRGSGPARGGARARAGARVGVRLAEDRGRALGLRPPERVPAPAVGELPPVLAAVVARRARCAGRPAARGRRQGRLGDPGDGGLRRSLRRRRRRRRPGAHLSRRAARRRRGAPAHAARAAVGAALARPRGAGRDPARTRGAGGAPAGGGAFGPPSCCSATSA